MAAEMGMAERDLGNRVAGGEGDWVQSFALDMESVRCPRYTRVNID